MTEHETEVETVPDEDTVMNIKMTKGEREDIKDAAALAGFRITAEWVRVTLKLAVRRVRAENAAPVPAGSPS